MKSKGGRLIADENEMMYQLKGNRWNVSRDKNEIRRVLGDMKSNKGPGGDNITAKAGR